MASTAYRLHSVEPDGLWTSEPMPAADRRHIVQDVIAGFLSGHPRWATDLEGNFIYGLDAKGKEMKAAPTHHAKAKMSRRHATKKSPAQLDREIAEALAQILSETAAKEPFYAARLGDRLRSVRQTAAAASRLRGRGARQAGRSAEQWVKRAQHALAEKRYDDAQSNLDSAEMYLSRAARAAGFR